jgi:glycosyltransferase involved in cell wall biosynthesis
MNLQILAVTNMYPTHADRSQGTFVEQQVKGLREAGVSVEVVHLDRQRKGMLAYQEIGRRVLEAVRRFEPDLVHVMYGGMLAGRTTGLRLGRPVIVSYCGSDLFGDAVGSWFRRIVVGAYRVRSSHHAAARADGVIVKSAGLRQALPAGIDDSKVWILPNGVDLDRFQPMDRARCQQEVGFDPNIFHVLFPNGKGDPRKRIDLAIAAVDALRAKGIKAKLDVLPRLPHDRVPLWLNASDVVVVTSIHEGSPNIVKEALACERPVVSVPVGDIPERLAGIQGCYLSAADPEVFADQLRNVYLGPRRVASRSHMEVLSLSNVSERLISIYETVLRGSPGHPPTGVEPLQQVSH